MNKEWFVKHKKWFMGIGVAVLLFISGLLIFNGQIQNHMVKQNQEAAIHKVTPSEIRKNQKKKGDFNYSHVKSLNPYNVYKSRYTSPSVIGMMSVPAVGMYLPISKGVSNANMTAGGATMRSDQKMGKGNYPIAGHYMTDYGALFSPLEHAQIGNDVYITDLSHIYQYRIYSKKIIPPTAVYVVSNTKKPIITLLTCADGGKNRWCLRGNLVGKSKATKHDLKTIFQLK